MPACRNERVHDTLGVDSVAARGVHNGDGNPLALATISRGSFVKTAADPRPGIVRDILETTDWASPLRWVADAFMLEHLCNKMSTDSIHTSWRYTDSALILRRSHGEKGSKSNRKKDELVIGVQTMRRSGRSRRYGPSVGGRGRKALGNRLLPRMNICAMRPPSRQIIAADAHRHGRPQRSGPLVSSRDTDI